MAVKSLDTRQNFSIVPAVDQDLAIWLHSFGQESKGTLVKDFLIGLVLLVGLLCILKWVNHVLNLIISLSRLNQNSDTNLAQVADFLFATPLDAPSWEWVWSLQNDSKVIKNKPGESQGDLEVALPRNRVIKKSNHDGTWTHNLLLRRQTPYPLGHAVWLATLLLRSPLNSSNLQLQE